MLPTPLSRSAVVGSWESSSKNRNPSVPKMKSVSPVLVISNQSAVRFSPGSLPGHISVICRLNWALALPAMAAMVAVAIVVVVVVRRMWKRPLCFSVESVVISVGCSCGTSDTG
jgi:hypothetical protein